MITTSKSILWVADAIDDREFVGCVSAWEETCVSLSAPDNSHQVYKVNRVVQNRKSRKAGKGGNFRVTTASTSGWLLTGQQHDHAVSWLVVLMPLKLCDTAIHSCCDSPHLIQHFPGVWSWKTNSCSRLDQWRGREPRDNYSYVSFQHFTRKGSVTKH